VWVGLAPRGGAGRWCHNPPPGPVPPPGARDEGWVRQDKGRRFSLRHREYDGHRLDGFDHDIGATLVASADAADEVALRAALTAWGLRPDSFVHPWQTDDPA
ncbi:hypothetical protein, partial [Streptomyces virginiae]|uniref:hypothetical protein n=1 Tax=Streptomyces virginiae TaxID=1961 RepID=UPI00364DF778